MYLRHNVLSITHKLKITKQFVIKIMLNLHRTNIYTVIGIETELATLFATGIMLSLHSSV